MAEQEFSKYERARIIGARGLQISMDAPLLTEASEEELDAMNFDPLKIAEKELDSGVLPISISKPMPSRNKEAIENVKVEEDVPSDAAKIAKEKEIEAEIVENGSMKAEDEGEGYEVEKEPAKEGENELE